MNLPNLLTLSRIPLMFVIVCLMRSHWQWAATLNFGLFLVAGLTDWLDGYIARKCGQVSNFGKLMDALTDKIFVLGLMIAFVGLGVVPLVLVLLMLCREFLITGMRMVAASKGVVFAAEKGGKQKTVTQLVALGFLLFVPMLQSYVSCPLSWDEGLRQAGLVLFIVATFFTLWSGFRYFMKYSPVVFGESKS